MDRRRTTRSPSPGRSGLWVVPDQRRRPSPGPPRGRICDDPDIRLHSIIYACLLYDVDPRTGRLLPPDPVTGQRRTRLDYVGQTIRGLDIRFGEHLDDKPWADLAVSSQPVIVEQGMWTKAERDAREKAAIERIRPRYNYEHNLGNPERIPIYDPATRRYVQLEHRHLRDRAAGLEPWLPLEQRGPVVQLAAQRAVVGAGLDGHEPRYPLTVAADVLARLGRFLARLPRRVKLAGLAATCWVAGIWAGAAWLTTQGWPPVAAWGLTAVLGTVLVVGALRVRAVRRWGRRRPRRRRR